MNGSFQPAQRGPRPKELISTQPRSFCTRITHPDGAWFGTLRDGLGRPYWLYSADPAAGVYYSSYRPDGLPSGQSRGNGASTWTSRDAVQRLNGLGHYYGGGTPADVLWLYAHNPASQIASASRDNDAYAWTRHYGVERSYVTNGLNQYSSVGDLTYGYDLNGNLTSDGVRTYAYDIENRMVGGNGAALSYDPLGRLYQVTASGGGVTRFLYDGDALIAEYNAAGEITRRYVHWDGADVPIMSYANATLTNPTYLHPDHQGSIVAISSAPGSPVTINSYDEYGFPGLNNAGRFQYTGQAWLAELGLYYYKARIYSPPLGRFMQTDPVGYADQFNLYGYVANDPVNHVDADGQRVTAIFAPSNRGFLIYDNDTRRAHFTQADTGYDFVGRRATQAIPSGTYSILEYGRGRDAFYRLEGRDSSFGDDTYQGRSLLRLHGRGQGYNFGCISMCTDVQMRYVNSILSSTSTTTAEVRSKAWDRNMPWGSQTERLRDYGELTVLSRGLNLNLNARTGEVTISLTTPARTGSRIPREAHICTIRNGRCE